MGIFAQESKLTRVLNRVGDLILLNVLTLAACMPVVTIGAAVSAMYAVTLKMVHDEEGKITAAYFHAFRENWKQSTAIWLIGGGLSGILYMDIWLLGKVQYSFTHPYKILLFILSLIVLMFTLFALVTQARFENSLKNTIKNGVLFCAIHFLKSILMFLVVLIPAALVFISCRTFSVIVLIGVSGPAFLTSIYFRSLFQDFEPVTGKEEISEENIIYEKRNLE